MSRHFIADTFPTYECIFLSIIVRRTFLLDQELENINRFSAEAKE